jgi:hypothetical protein
LFLKGVHGGSFLGDMAIDDVRVTPLAQCLIPGGTTTTTLPTTTTLGLHTPLSCNFETDICKWTDDTSASGKWKRRQGQLNGNLFGPNYGKKKNNQ